MTSSRGKDGPSGAAGDPVLKAKYDRLADLLRGTSPERLRTLLVKDRMVTVRVSASEREGMKRAARSCGLSVSEYLLRLNAWASGLLANEGDMTVCPGKAGPSGAAGDRDRAKCTEE